MKSDEICMYFILCYFILFNFILFNFILFYFILFCFILSILLRSTKKKSSDGELGGQKAGRLSKVLTFHDISSEDWTVRVVDGLEVDIEEKVRLSLTKS